MMQHLWCHLCEEVEGFHGYQDVFSVCVCVWVWEGVPMTVSLTSSLCFLWVRCVLSPWQCLALSGVMRQSILHCRKHKASTTQSLWVPVRPSVWLRGLLAWPVRLPDWIIKSQISKCCCMESENCPSVVTLLCYFWFVHVSICVSRPCSRHLDEWLWAVSAIGLSSDCLPFESAGVGWAAYVPMCACVGHMIKQCFSVSLTVFTGQFVFRVQLGWDVETGSSTDLASLFFFPFSYLFFSLLCWLQSAVWISAQCFPIIQNASVSHLHRR